MSLRSSPREFVHHLGAGRCLSPPVCQRANRAEHFVCLPLSSAYWRLSQGISCWEGDGTCSCEVSGVGAGNQARRPVESFAAVESPVIRKVRE
jgi:hypothetical protein